MNEFLANNWFSIITLLGVAGSALIHYGISKQRRDQAEVAVVDLKNFVREEVNKLDEGRKHNLALIQGQAAVLQSHMTNADIHVSSILLELLKTRHEFVTQQLTETRNDIGRIEQRLVKD